MRSKISHDNDDAVVLCVKVVSASERARPGWETEIMAAEYGTVGDFRSDLDLVRAPHEIKVHLLRSRWINECYTSAAYIIGSQEDLGNAPATSASSELAAHSSLYRISSRVIVCTCICLFPKRRRAHVYCIKDFGYYASVKVAEGLLVKSTSGSLSSVIERHTRVRFCLSNILKPRGSRSGASESKMIYTSRSLETDETARSIFISHLCETDDVLALVKTISELLDSQVLGST